MKTQTSSLEYPHFPVMLSEIIQILSPIKGGLFADCTFGGGGYSKAILNFPNTKVISFDRDLAVVSIANKLEKKFKNRFKFYRLKFSTIDKVLKKDVEAIIFDLGLSSIQLKNLSRGFSFNSKQTLDMCMGLSNLSAQDVVNKFSEKEKGVYNSLVITNYQLEILQEYKKQKLVPFGEFLPMENLLSKIGLKKITEGHGSFLKGQKQNNLIIDKLNILPLICYEVIFTELIQSSNDKTNLIINISEDGWFGQSIGPYQHFTKSIFRAIENNTFLVRSANKGISAIINNKGEIVKKLSSLEAGNIQIEVPLIESKNKNKNDLIFFVLLITYIFIFKLYKKNNGK